MNSCLKLGFSAGLVLCTVFSCYAQRVPTAQEIEILKKEYTYKGNYRPKESLAGVCLLDKPQVVDSTLFEAVYDAEIMVDTLDNVPAKDRVVLQVGRKYYKFFSQICWQRDMNHTLFELNQASEQIGTDAAYKVVVDYAIFRNLEEQKITNRHLLPRVNNQLFEYDEKYPDFCWQMTPDTCSFAGYLCHKAIGHYAGRIWSVWFTSDIPVDGGLWKFNGLPGLILQASDEDRHYKFNLLQLEKKAIPIIRYRISVKRFERSEYREFERRLHEHPIPSTGNKLHIEIDASGNSNFYFLPDDWTIPYNPIERE